jgi:hypothetical protein
MSSGHLNWNLARAKTARTCLETYTLLQVYSRRMNTQSPLEIACSLTPADYADRSREFRRLFATALRNSRREPIRLYLALDPAVVREENVRDLLRREQQCCSFFSFTVSADPAEINVEASVPNGAAECLDDLERMADRALRARI